MSGLRGRRFVRRFFFSACVALLALPLLTVYTHLFGREVSLRVDRCERQVRYGYECHGSWTDSDGHQHSTEVAHVGPKDVGRTVKARLGPWPLSAHAGGLGSEGIMLVPGRCCCSASPAISCSGGDSTARWAPRRSTC